MRLTADEIKLITFVLGALLIGAIVKHCRHEDQPAIPPASAATTPAPGSAPETD